MVVAVAIDEDIEAVKPLAKGITIPVLLDRDHITTELFAISNVPTVIWIDGNDRIVRPNASEMGTDKFIEYTGKSREIHHQKVRDWVVEGVVPADASVQVEDFSEDEVRARLIFRMATHRLRNNDEVGAKFHFERAIKLAPLDFTISRAAMPLTGKSPFGEDFADLFARYRKAGSPYHGI